MGTFEQGYMGGFRGKLGTAVGSTWKGISVKRNYAKSHEGQAAIFQE